MSPRTYHSRQHGDRAYGHATACVPLHAVIQANDARLRLRILARQRHDALGGQAGDLGSTLRPILLHPRTQFRFANRVPLQIIPIFQPFRKDHVQYPQRQCRICAGVERYVLVALRRRARTVRIDGDHLCAVRSGALDKRPQMRVGCQRIGAPQQHELCIRELLGIGTDALANGVSIPRRTRRRADRAVEQRRAQLVEEAPVHRAVHQHAPCASIRIRQDRLGSVLSNDPFEATGDLIERFVPADALPLPRAARSNPAHGVQHTVGVVGTLDVARHFGAQKALRDGMRRVTRHLDRLAVLDGHEHGAGVGAVVRAGAAHNLDIWISRKGHSTSS
jgi:hypothetical protein